MSNETVNNISSSEFGKLFTEYRSWFVSIAYRYVRDMNIAEDLVTDSFVSFWENRDAIPGDVNMKAYILTSVKNKCLKYLQSKLRRTKIEKDIHSTLQRMLLSDIQSLSACNPDEIFSQEIGALLNEATKKMSATARTVFQKSRHDGKTYKDIADEMNVAVTRVHWEMSRALQILRRELADYLPLFIPVIAIFLFI